MKRIVDASIQELLSKADIVSVVGSYVRLERTGSGFKGLCPFHTEKTPSFNVNREKGFYYCFGCKKGGNAVSFVMEMEKCGFREAVERLADTCKVPLAYEGSEDDSDLDASRERDSLYELYERISLTFHHFLTSDPRGERALEYVKSRKLGKETMEQFRLGYAPADRAWLHGFLRKKSYSERFLAGTGLFSTKYPQSSFFSDRLLFPIRDTRGRVVAFGGRLLGGDGPKYLNSPDSPIFHKQDNLYGLSDAVKGIRSEDRVILCEGYMDAISIHASGLPIAVAPLGTAFTEPQARLLARHTERLDLCFDMDKAGKAAAERALGIAEAIGLSVRLIVFDGAKDPAEIFEKEGPGQLKKSMETAINADEYLLRNAENLLATGGIEKKSEAFSYLFPFIARLSSDVKRDEFLERAARRLSADPQSVRADFSGYRDRGILPSRRKAGDGSSDSVFTPSADAAFLAALVLTPSLFPRVRTEISPADFDDEPCRNAFIALEESYRREELELTSILARMQNPSFADFIMRKAANGEYSMNPERFVDDGLSGIRERTLSRKRDRIMERIRDFDSERDGDSVSQNDLLYEKMYLDGELARIKDERHGR